MSSETKLEANRHPIFESHPYPHKRQRARGATQALTDVRERPPWTHREFHATRNLLPDLRHHTQVVHTHPPTILQRKAKPGVNRGYFHKWLGV